MNGYKDNFVGYIPPSKIPLRSFWVLLQYAFNNFKDLKKLRNLQARDKGSKNLPQICALILLYYLRKIFGRGLNSAMTEKRDNLSRLRGHVDLLRTETEDLLCKGKIACIFQERTFNTPKYKLVRAALEKAYKLLKNDSEASLIRKECGIYANHLRLLGVTGKSPAISDISRESWSAAEGIDRLAVESAILLLKEFLPASRSGDKPLTDGKVVDVDKFLPALFEEGMRGFYRLRATNWKLIEDRLLQWPIKQQSQNSSEINMPRLPGMEMDIGLVKENRKVIIDTKFKAWAELGREKNDWIFHPHDIRQIYTYLRTQENPDQANINNKAVGILLYPCVKSYFANAAGNASPYADIPEWEIFIENIQGHKIIIATVNLEESIENIEKRLLNILSLASEE